MRGRDETSGDAGRGEGEGEGASAGPGYLAPYRRAIDDFGVSFEAMLWASKEKQLGRFAVMAGLADLTGRVVLDAGCGLGDFAQWLIEHEVAYGRFVGLEGLADMVRAASERGLPEASFHACDFVAEPDAFARFKPDVVTFSGSLNTLRSEAATDVLRRAWAAAAEGVVFNFLSAKNHVPNAVDPSPAVRWEPAPMVEFALSLTPNVLFRQDYFAGHDATIAMLK